MSKKVSLIFLVIIISLLCGCAALPPFNPVMSENRSVKSVINQEKRVEFKEPMVWYDSIKQTRGVLFPEGIYILEAEDDTYYYFKAPKELDYRSFEKGKTSDVKLIPGGLFLSKGSFNMVPAGAYSSLSNENKTLTWKLGSDFMDMEGKKWKKLY
jgi:hypothetical protein